MKELLITMASALVVGGIAYFFVNRHEFPPRRKSRDLGYLSDGWGVQSPLVDEERRRQHLEGGFRG